MDFGGRVPRELGLTKDYHAWLLPAAGPIGRLFWLLAARRGGRRWQDLTHDPAVPWEGVSSGHGHFSLVAPLEPSTRVDGTQADLED